MAALRLQKSELYRAKPKCTGRHQPFIGYWNERRAELKSALGVNVKTLHDDADTLTNSFESVPFSRGKYDQYFIQFYSTYTHRFSPKWVFKAGLRERLQLYNIRQQFVYEDTFRTLTEGRGNSALTQLFAEVKWSPIARVSVLLGVNALHHTLNNAFSAEPRLSIAWNPKGNQRQYLQRTQPQPETPAFVAQSVGL